MCEYKVQLALAMTEAVWAGNFVNKNTQVLNWITGRYYISLNVSYIDHIHVVFQSEVDDI